MKVSYSKLNMVRGAVIYSSGDTIASLLLDEFMWSRLLGMIIIGATLYAFEIPNYFLWIDKKTANQSGILKNWSKTVLAILYFNPIWIFRHLFFIKLFSGHLHEIDTSLIVVAFWSFLVNVPISIVANYTIQNKINLKWRFLASAIFSALMAIYYALSETIFS